MEITYQLRKNITAFLWKNYAGLAHIKNKVRQSLKISFCYNAVFQIAHFGLGILLLDSFRRGTEHFPDTVGYQWNYTVAKFSTPNRPQPFCIVLPLNLNTKIRNII